MSQHPDPDHRPFLLAAAMDVSGGLNKLLDAILSKANSVTGLIAASLASGATMIALTSHGGVTALIVGGCQTAYREQNLGLRICHVRWRIQ